MRILVADDDFALQVMYRQWFERWGYDFDIVDNGRDAVDLACKGGEPYDLCVMDVQMPMMDGIQAICEIRKQPGYLPVLSCSSDIFYEDSCRAAGADDFICKPWEPEPLKEKLEGLAVKVLVLLLDGQGLVLKWRRPENADELQELRDIDRRGLAKLVLLDAPKRILVRKDARADLVGDLMSGREASAEFLDHSPDDPGVVRVYAKEIFARKLSVSRLQYEHLARGDVNRNLASE